MRQSSWQSYRCFIMMAEQLAIASVLDNCGKATGDRITERPRKPFTFGDGFTSSNSGTICPGLMRPREPPLRLPLGHSLYFFATCAQAGSCVFLLARDNSHLRRNNLGKSLCQADSSGDIDGTTDNVFQFQTGLIAVWSGNKNVRNCGLPSELI